MSPEEKLLQNEEGKDAGQNIKRALQVAAQPLKGIRQEVNEGVAEQTADGQTDHDEYDSL